MGDMEAEGTSTRAERLDARKRLERANVHVGLRTYLPTDAENPEPGKWSASWWNGPTRAERGYATEADMILDLFDVFGRPGDEP